MKKYIIPVAALLLTTVVAGAQVTPQKTNSNRSVAKTSIPSTTKKTTTSAVSVSTSTPVNKANTGVAIKRKHHHKKKQSVKSASK